MWNEIRITPALDGKSLKAEASIKGAGLAWGGGSTPALTHDLVLFTDNQTTVHLVALDAQTGEKVADATGYLYGCWQLTDDGNWRYEILDFDTGETAYSYVVSDDTEYNNMAGGVIASPDGNGLYVLNVPEDKMW